MHITLFSFVTAVLLSSLLIVALYLSRKSVKTIRMLNFGYLACLYLFCLGRMVFSIELPFTVAVNAPSLMNPVFNFQGTGISILGKSLSLLEVLLILWAVGAAFLLTRFFIRYHQGKKVVDKIPKQENQAIQEVLNELQRENAHHYQIQVLCCQGLSTPCGIGLLRRQILLPSQEYTEEELFHILCHELQHFQTHDLLVKWMIRVFQCLFWWNPLVYLLGKDLDQVLEIKCDLSVVKNYSRQETLAYMRTIKNQLERSMDIEKTAPVGSTALVGNFTMSNVEERFSYIVKSLKPNKWKELSKPVFTVLFLALIIGSYSIVLQSNFEEPEVDENGNHIDYMTQDDIRVRKLKNGTYEQVDKFGVVPIPKEIAENLIEQGAEMIEE